jgi:membrane fusion protein (multidrug efflux system)
MTEITLSWSAPQRRLAASAAAVLALGGCHKPPPPPPSGPPVVGVITLQAQSVPLSTELPGRTSPYTTSDVRPQVNGLIKARLFVEGSEVKAGQVLYQIDPAPYQATYDQAKATLANASANLTTTRLKAERYADLVKINAVAKQDYDDADAAYKQALATVEQDRASLESAAINLGYTKVRAPISGRIGRSDYTAGALVTSGQTNALATITALDPIYVDVSQSSDEMLQLKRRLAQGQIDSAGPQSTEVRLKLADDSLYPQPGRLRFAEVTVDQTTGSVTLRAVFPNPNQTLLPGMYVREELTQARDPNGILAPQQGISRDPKGQATAMVVGPDGKVQPRMVVIDQAVGNDWLVTSGLKPGDRLIVQGLLNLRPGTPVKAVPADLAKDPSGVGAPGGQAPARPSAS